MEDIETTLDSPGDWIHKTVKERKPADVIAEIKKPIECKTCKKLHFAYSTRNIFGGFCFDCDCDAAFEKGKILSEKSEYIFRISTVEVAKSTKK